MKQEYVSIMEAARRCGISDKTIRRAVHAGKLAARRPQPNRAEIAISDLEAWRALSGDVAEQRLAAMEVRIQELEHQVEQLTMKVSEQDGVVAQLQLATKPAVQPSEPGVPADMVLLQDFAFLHAVNGNEAERRWRAGFIAGQKVPWPGYKRATVAIGQKGMRDFWVQFHEAPGFQACNDCPHKEK